MTHYAQHAGMRMLPTCLTSPRCRSPRSTLISARSWSRSVTADYPSIGLRKKSWRKRDQTASFDTGTIPTHPACGEILAYSDEDQPSIWSQLGAKSERPLRLLIMPPVTP